MSIETLKKFLSLMKVTQSIEGALPSDIEQAIELIDYMHDKCEFVILLAGDRYITYSWHSASGENEEGWMSSEWDDIDVMSNYTTIPTKDLPIEGGERVKFVNIQKL